MDASVSPDLQKLTRNPVVKLIDKRDAPLARTFKEHKRLADEVANTLSMGALFTLVQRRKKGFWVSEWTVARGKGSKAASRRRAGHGATLEQAIDPMLDHPSFHASHFYFPEAGVSGWLKRGFGKPS